MSLSKFAFSVAANVVSKGAKVSNFANATIYTSPVKDKFVIDSKAIDLLKINELKRVILVDMGSKANTIAAFEGVKLENATRFIVTAGYLTADDQVRGLKIGKNGIFSYTKVWGAMLNDQDDVKEINIKELVDVEKAAIRTSEETGKVTYAAKQKVFFRIEPLMAIVTEGEAPEHVIASVGDDVEQPLYSMVEFMREDVKEEEMDEAVEETTNDSSPE